MNEQTNDIFDFNIEDFWKYLPNNSRVDCLTATHPDTGDVLLIPKEKIKDKTQEEILQEINNFYAQYNFVRQSILPEQIINLSEFLEKDGYLLRNVALLVTYHLINVYEYLFQELLKTDEQKFIDYFLDPERKYPPLMLITEPEQNNNTVKINRTENLIEEAFKKVVIFTEETFKISNIWIDAAIYVLNHLGLISLIKMEAALGKHIIENMTNQEVFIKFTKYFNESMSQSDVLAEQLEGLLTNYAQQIIKPIIEQLDLREITLENLDHFLEFAPTQKDSYPITELRLTEPIIPFPTNVAIFSSMQAQLRKDLWQQDSQSLAYFKHQAKGNPSNYIEHQIAHPGQIEILPWQQAEQIIDKFGFDTVKLHLIFAAHTMKYERPWENKFTLKATDIIKYLGWDKRTDLPLHEKLNKIAQTAFVLDCLLVKSVWIEGKNPKGGINASTPIGRIWNMVIDLRGQLNLKGKIEKPEEVYITIQPGLIFQSFLNKGGSYMKEALYQFGYLAQNILQIDPYHEELTFRLAIHITIESRYHTNGAYQVETLLKAVLPTSEVEKARTDKRKGYELKKRWEQALKGLQNLQWQIEFDASYPEWLQPSSQVPKPTNSQKTPIIEQLLRAKVYIKPPKPIPELIKEIQTPKKKKRKRLPTTSSNKLTPEQIRSFRQIKGWSQRELATRLQVSNGLVGSWETGKRTPSPEIEARLLNLLEIDN